MNSQEIETALREQIPLTVLIWEDDAYGLISWKMDLELGHDVDDRIRQPGLRRLRRELRRPRLPGRVRPGDLLPAAHRSPGRRHRLGHHLPGRLLRESPPDRRPRRPVRTLLTATMRCSKPPGAPAALPDELIRDLIHTGPSPDYHPPGRLPGHISLQSRPENSPRPCMCELTGEASWRRGGDHADRPDIHDSRPGHAGLHIHPGGSRAFSLSFPIARGHAVDSPNLKADLGPIRRNWVCRSPLQVADLVEILLKEAPGRGTATSYWH